MKKVFAVAFLAACSSKPALEPAASGLPKADRFFAVRLEAQGSDAVLGADGTSLWAADLTQGTAHVRWRLTGLGTPQLVTAGDTGHGWRVFVAWGRGRGALAAPVVLQEVNPISGEATELFRFAGERNDAAHLSVSDVDSDGITDVAFAFFETKYMVRAHHITAKGVVEAAPVRMAMSRAYADVDGDGKNDEIVGRPYGDATELPGDLRVNLASGASLLVPTDRGVRDITVASLPGDARPSIFFADGWTSSYAKEARAQVKRARWDGKAFAVEPVGASADEYSFEPIQMADVDGDGKPELVARGNKRFSVFKLEGEAWQKRTLDVPLGTVTRLADGFGAVVGESKGARVVRL